VPNSLEDRPAWLPAAAFSGRDSPVNLPNGEAAALSWKPTAEALGRYRLRAAGTFCIGLVPLMAVFLVIGFVSPPAGSLLDRAMVYVAGFSVVPFFGGLVATFKSFRIRRILSRHPWVEWRCRFKEVPMATPNGAPTLLLVDPQKGTQHVLSTPTWVWRWRKLVPLDQTTVWYAGNPHWMGVVSPSGGRELFWTRRIRFGPWRRRLLRKMGEPEE